MKKFLALLIIFVMLFSCCLCTGCGKDELNIDDDYQKPDDR